MIDPQTLVSVGILIVTALISIPGFSNYGIIEACRHYPYEEYRNKSYYRWLTCGFVHGSVMHLLLNLFVLWQFGFVIERLYTSMFGLTQGRMIYFTTYLLIMVLSCIPSYIKNKNNPNYASIGASGAISGILFIYIRYFPWNTLLIYGIVPLPAIMMGVLYLIYSWWAARNSNDGVDHEAHYYGAITGFLLSLIIDQVPRLL
ncbi:MAG: rhomboid family intramembrane serine protease [Saprospiraceae bacterium]|nr:rhomboid family intramembrane serine protease [Saprospiraceae bacterium]HMX89529.1 rhomboid family intramembrane serine protease [Saprospiraceae bacterium]HMZ40886.1 rhomboid family intramembrane serine protease [Saprospiraceae bacterium]HNA64016.1 rhomboid family intramembrane serine protease [Saprospiraceae bacterium]HNB31740.1 rhomboid family intramembrane serine protease [Saprospiraceae bacterium]